MTKTQALQRLFTALTDVPISEVSMPTNTSTKMVELLAMAAENGEIGGGGGVETGTFIVKNVGENELGFDALNITDGSLKFANVVLGAGDTVSLPIPITDDGACVGAIQSMAEIFYEIKTPETYDLTFDERDGEFVEYKFYSINEQNEINIEVNAESPK